MSIESQLLETDELVISNAFKGGKMLMLEFSKAIQIPALVSQVDSFGRTLLHIAVEENYLWSIPILLEAGADANAKTKDGKPLLQVAIEIGHSEFAKTLLEVGADANTVLADGSTILGIAVEKNDTLVVKALLEVGADANTVLADGSTILGIAVERGYLGITKALLEAGADVNVVLQGRSKKDASTTLGIAAINDDLGDYFEITKMLLEKLALIKQTTPWNIALETQDEYIVETALKLTVDPTLADGSPLLGNSDLSSIL